MGPLATNRCRGAKIVSVTDAQGDTPTEEQHDSSDAGGSPAPNDNRDYRGDFGRGLADRLFPGPSRRMSEQYAKHLDRLLKQGGGEQANLWRERAKSRADGATQPPRNSIDSSRSPALPGTAPASGAQGAPAVSADDVAQVRDALDKQNELLQAILSTSLDAQTDARATAQNSRTFAWAGTAIAVLTLIATVISIVAAVRAH